MSDTERIIHYNYTDNFLLYSFTLGFNSGDVNESFYSGSLRFR